MMNKMIKIGLLSICLLVQQNNANPFNSIIFNKIVSKSSYLTYIAITTYNKANEIIYNENRFKNASETKIKPYQGDHVFLKDYTDAALTGNFSHKTLIKFLNNYNDCLETAINKDIANQNTFNTCYEYGFEPLKKSE